MVYLCKLNVDACVGYLEHVIEQLQEQGADFHDKLAEIYLERARRGSREGSDQDAYKVLLSFLSSSQHYRANRLIQKVPAEGVFTQVVLHADRRHARGPRHSARQAGSTR